MANLPTKFEPLEPPDVKRPDRTQSLPAWVTSRLACVTESRRRNENGTWRTVATLPASQILGLSERRAIEGHVAALDAVLHATPMNSAKAEGETLTHIAKLTLALPGQKATEKGAEATGEAYQAALDDLPPWAVAAAIRRWYRGDAPPVGSRQHDYNWRPAPAVLRSIAFAEAAAIRGRAIELRRLLTAEQAIEFSDDHRKTMLERLVKLFGGMDRNAPTTSEAAE